MLRRRRWTPGPFPPEVTPQFRREVSESCEQEPRHFQTWRLCRGSCRACFRLNNLTAVGGIDNHWYVWHQALQKTHPLSGGLLKSCRTKKLLVRRFVQKPVSRHVLS